MMINLALEVYERDGFDFSSVRQCYIRTAVCSSHVRADDLLKSLNVYQKRTNILLCNRLPRAPLLHDVKIA